MTTHNIYVIELDKEVLEKKKFRDANPDYKEGKPCVYVGMTSKTPEERFQLHKEGYRFLAIAAVVTFILLLISNFFGIISFIVTIWVYYFFRDPERFSIND